MSRYTGPERDKIPLCTCPKVRDWTPGTPFGEPCDDCNHPLVVAERQERKP